MRVMFLQGDRGVRGPRGVFGLFGPGGNTGPPGFKGLKGLIGHTVSDWTSILTDMMHMVSQKCIFCQSQITLFSS